MQVSLTALKGILLTNVCEVQFVRRIPIPYRTDQRKMWCTNSAALLNSFNGKTVLNYFAPRFAQKYNPEQYNLCVTWDILCQDYRQINMDSCTLIQKMPANEEFWKYFNENILTMTQLEKIVYMDA
tara:strand:+ start:370 stop:747 length:378 start_codon:yes stop_codon:yes gene_type:complete